jgi:hypothetical protein
MKRRDFLKSALAATGLAIIKPPVLSDVAGGLEKPVAVPPVDVDMLISGVRRQSAVILDNMGLRLDMAESFRATTGEMMKAEVLKLVDPAEIGLDAYLDLGRELDLWDERREFTRNAIEELCHAFGL